MRPKLLLSVFFTLISLLAISQEKLFAITVNPELKKNANAVVRKNETEVKIVSYNRMFVKNHRIITVFNEKGKKHINAFLNYDGSLSIKKIEAKVYNAFGEEIKKYKKKDFKDVSVADGISIFNDNRALYFDYTATSYPYTVEYFEEYTQSTTAFMPVWRPLENYYVSTEFSSYKIINESGINIKTKASNFENYNITELSENHYEAKNLKAIKYEVYSPTFNVFSPSLKLALQEFEMKGVKGTNTSWLDFGKWVSNSLIIDTQELPEEVKKEVIELTANAKTNKEKAKLVYEFMQSKTRYISVQVGIGGWKPMLAGDVDRLGYGDCKALSNYTKSLLNAVGVESYYTIIYGGRDIRDIDKTFSSQQGNHAILAVPDNEELIFLECTSQTDPFGYIANFTDDRDVLIIKPEGGEIVHTKTYETKDNLQKTVANVSLDKAGSLKADIEITSYGTQYGQHRRRLKNETQKNQKLYYKEYLDNINNLEILSLSQNDNKENIVFIEKVKLSANKYASKAGDRLLVEVNMFNKNAFVPPRYEERKLPFEIDRGYTDVDEYKITLPTNLEIEALKDDVVIKNKFGEYIISLKKLTDNTFSYSRKLVINNGSFAKEEYKDFRDFKSKIAKHDKSRIVLKHK